MKVFEVVMDYFEGEELKRQVEYVRCFDNQLVTVAKYMEEFCRQYEMELKSVKEVLIICRHIDEKDIIK